MPRTRTIALYGFAALALDLAIKYWVVASAPSFEGFFLLGGLFGVTFFLNTEFAWGIPLGNTASALLMVCAIVGIGFYWRAASPEKRSLGAPLVLVIFGALGNLASRIAWGGVVDYIAVPLGGVINLADVMVVVGVGLLFFNKSKFQSSNVK